MVGRILESLLLKPNWHSGLSRKMLSTSYANFSSQSQHYWRQCCGRRGKALFWAITVFGESNKQTYPSLWTWCLFKFQYSDTNSMASFAAESRYAILLYFWRTIRAVAMGSAVISMAVHRMWSSLAIFDCDSLHSTTLTWPVTILLCVTSEHHVRQ